MKIDAVTNYATRPRLSGRYKETRRSAVTENKPRNAFRLLDMTKQTFEATKTPCEFLLADRFSIFASLRILLYN